MLRAVKCKKPVVINPYSTGITLQLIPKAAVDKIPILSMAYGLSASADGNDLPVDLQPAGDLLGRRLDVRALRRRAKKAASTSSRARSSASIYLDAPYGKEPIPLLEALAKEYGFELKLYPVPAAEMQNQSSQWLERPPRPSGLDLPAGLGRDEPDRRQGSRQDQLPDGPPHRRVVVGQRRRCASGRRRRQGLSVARLQPGRRPTSRSSRTS